MGQGESDNQDLTEIQISSTARAGHEARALRMSRAQARVRVELDPAAPILRFGPQPGGLSAQSRPQAAGRPEPKAGRGPRPKMKVVGQSVGRSRGEIIEERMLHAALALGMGALVVLTYFTGN